MDIKTLYNRVIGGHLIRRDEALFYIIKTWKT